MYACNEIIYISFASGSVKCIYSKICKFEMEISKT